MASKTYKAHVLVLKKTKLGEKDLIVTMLDESGMLVKGVAKGGRKPGGSFAARLELFSEADVLLAAGRSLDVVCDARIIRPGVGANPMEVAERSSCAAPLAELLCTIAQPELPQPRVFEISKASFDRMLSRETAPEDSLAILSASLWKVMSQVGFRPSFSRCSLCGGPHPGLDGADGRARVALSIADGGVVCDSCQRPADALEVDINAIRWCEALIRSRYDDIVTSGIDAASCFDVLQLARMWASAHTGRNLRSLDFLFASGLFS